MSEIDAAFGVVHQIGNAIKEVREEIEKKVSNATAEAQGRKIEGEITAEQRDLRSDGIGERSGEAQREYRTGDELPPQAQTDGHWPFGQPDTAARPGPFDWGDFAPEQGKSA